MARWVKGKTAIKWYPKTASVTFTFGDIVIFTSGYVATATAQSTKHIGTILTAVTSGDTNFALTDKVPVEVPRDKNAELEIAVTGTLLTTDIGLMFDLSTAGLVNQDGTTYGVVTCVGFISTSKGRFILNSSLDNSQKTWA